MGPLPACCCSFKAFLHAIKSHLNSCLVFLDPFVDTSSYRILNSAQQEVNQESGLLSKHQQKMGLASRLLWNSVIAVENLGKAGRPVCFMGWRQCAQQIVQSSIKSLTLPITCWMIWGCAGLLYSVEVTKLLDESTLEITALVRMDSSGDGKLIKTIPSPTHGPRWRHVDPGWEWQVYIC